MLATILILVCILIIFIPKLSEYIGVYLSKYTDIKISDSIHQSQLEEVYRYYQKYQDEWDYLIYECPEEVPIKLFNESSRFRPIINYLFKYHQIIYPNLKYDYDLISNCLDYYNGGINFIDIRNTIIQVDNDLLNAITELINRRKKQRITWMLIVPKLYIKYDQFMPELAIKIGKYI